MANTDRTLAGRYALGVRIGRGGMGAVYRATDLVLGRTVAVKILAGSLADAHPTSVARFEREARAAAALSHPGVVAVYDAGADEGADERFIVMELVSGRSLDAILRDEGPLPPDRAAGITAGVADALTAAHGAGIVHRDIKPGNVMVDAGGAVKVLDFGIARAIDGTALTDTASVVGTAAYMSPEQARGAPADARSDIYALACVLYALLTGHPPFRGEHAAAVLHQHINAAPTPLRRRDTDVPADLDALIMEMLAKDPHQRPQTAAEVRDRLRVGSETRGSAAAAPPARSSPTAPTRRLDAIGSEPLRRRGSRGRRLILPSALAVAIVVGGLVALAHGGSTPHAGTGARRPAAVARTTTTRSTVAGSSSSSTPAPASTPTSSATATPPHTVSGAAGALTALTTQDAQAGAIDQQAAQQITNSLSDLLNSYEQGHTPDVQHKLGDLYQHVTAMEQHGDIRGAATPGLTHAVDALATALGVSPAALSQPAGGPASPPPAGGGHPAHPGAKPPA